jgi:hypothetical protein
MSRRGNPKKPTRLSPLARARQDAQHEQEMRLALAQERDELVNVLTTIHGVLFNSRTYCRLSGLGESKATLGAPTEQSDQDDVPLTPAQQQELRERLDAYHRDPGARVSLEDALTLIRRDRNQRDCHDKRVEVKGGQKLDCKSEI